MTDSKSSTPIIFVEIPGAVGYEAGSDGHIYSRRVQFYGGLQSERIQLKEKTDRDGYREVSIYFSDKRRSVKVHQLILLAFHGPCPPGMMSCHFPDADRSHNTPDNLMWGTNSTNQLHRRDQGTDHSGAKNLKAKLTDEIVSEIRQLYEVGGITQSQLAERFGVFQSTIGRIVRGQTWIKGVEPKAFTSRCGPRRRKA